MTRSNSPPGRLLATLLTVLLVLAFPSGAVAHTTLPGAGDLVNGALHPFAVPAHLLILLGFSIALGQRVPFRPGRTLLIFAPCAALALALTTRFTFTVPAPALTGLALCGGAVVAVAKPLPFAAWGILVALVAVAIGLDSSVEDATGAAAFRTLLGTLAGTTVFLSTGAFYTGMAVEKKRQWLDIALRVAGSWIVAISLLMLAFALRK